MTATVFFPLLPKLPLEKEPISVDDAVRLLRADCRGEEHRGSKTCVTSRDPVPSLFLRLLPRTGTPLIASDVAHLTAEREKQERVRSQLFATFCSSLVCPNRSSSARKEVDLFPASGRRLGVKPSAVCMCAFSAPSQAHRAQARVLARPHPRPLCASDGLHVGND